MDVKPPETQQWDPDDLIRARLLMLVAYANMVDEAYDALVNHGVNYRELPDYKDRRLLERAERFPLNQGAALYVQWMGKLVSSIRAAVKRTTFRKV